MPGAIAAWMLPPTPRRRRAASCRSTLLLAPAIKHARDGYAVTRSQARLTAEKLPEMDKAVGFTKAFLLDGKVPEVGARLKQTAFAATLDHLAHAGLDDFYRGDVGREIAADLDRIGSPVTRADWKAIARLSTSRSASRRKPARSTTRRRRRRVSRR